MLREAYCFLIWTYVMLRVDSQTLDTLDADLGYLKSLDRRLKFIQDLRD
jgi:hypothetical protein